MGRHGRAVPPRVGGQEVGLRGEELGGLSDEVEAQLDVVAFGERRGRLDREIAVSVVDLVEEVDYVRRTAQPAQPLRESLTGAPDLRDQAHHVPHELPSGVRHVLATRRARLRGVVVARAGFGFGHVWALRSRVSGVSLGYSSTKVFSPSPSRTCFMTLPVAFRGRGSRRISMNSGTLK